MKVRILTQHYYPDSATVGILLTQLAEGLASDGFSVEVFTSQPRDDKANKSPKYEERNSVKIFRLSSFFFNKHKKSGVLLNSLYYFFKTFIKVLFISEKDKAIYFIVTNPPYLHLIGSVLSYIRKTKFVNLLYDVIPEPYINLKFISEKSLYVKLWKYLNRLAFKRSARIVVLTDKIRETIEQNLFSIYKNKEHFKKICVIPNWADEDYFKPIDFEDNIFIKKNNLQNKFIINYAGTIGILQKFSSLMELAKTLKDEDIAFLFIGEGVKKKSLEQIKEKHKLENVHFFPYLNKDILPYAQAASHLSIAHLEKEVEGYCMPSKLCTILATGTPVLAICEPYSELAEIVIESNCGFAVSHENINEVTDFIKKLRSEKSLDKEMRRNARILFEKYFTKKTAIESYKELINNMIS